MDTSRTKSLPSVEVRPISELDAPAVAELSRQLGYEAPVETITERIHKILTLEDHAAFVACLDTAVFGWIDVSISHHLQSDPLATIGGLVVSENARSRGIGKILVAEAECWAKARGCRILRVRSRSTREGAHRFYLREGFRQTKLSAVFEKKLDGTA